MKTDVSTGSQPLPAGVYYLLSDLLYRSAALTDSTAAIKEAYDTDAYGNTLIYSDPGADNTWFTDDDVASLQPACEYIFTGRQYDPESQIYFYRARYYHPPLGRFVGRDPIEYAFGLDLYEYVQSRPTALFDPLGLQSPVVVAGWLAAAIAAGDVAAVQAILDLFSSLLSVALIAAATQFLAKVRACESTYNQYKALSCPSCKKCTTKTQAIAIMACLRLEIALRSQYVSDGCDFVLAGSIARGSQKAQDGHVQQVDQKTKMYEDCVKMLPTLPN